MSTDEIQLDRYSAGPDVTFRAVHKPTGLVATAATEQKVLAELGAKVAAEAVTTTEVVSVYDTRSASAKVKPPCWLELDESALHVTRAVATYCRINGGPWEVGILRLAGHDSTGVTDDALVLESPDLPEWLMRFVADNLPKD